MLEGDNPGVGHLPSFFVPTPGAFRQLMCPHSGEFARFFQKKKMHGGHPGGGGEAWALLELTDV